MNNKSGESLSSYSPRDNERVISKEEQLWNQFLSLVNAGNKAEADIVFREFYELLAARIRKAMFRKDIPADVIDDQIQELTIKLLTNPPSGHGNFIGLLNTMILHRIYDFWRTRAKKKVDQSGDFDIADGAGSAAETAIDLEEIDTVRKKAQQLLGLVNNRDRTVIIAVLNDENTEELAQRLGISKWSVYKIYSRSLSKMQRAQVQGPQEIPLAQTVEQSDNFGVPAVTQLHRLDHRYQAVVYGLLRDGKSERQLARELQISTWTVRQRFFEAISMIRDQMAA